MSVAFDSMASAHILNEELRVGLKDRASMALSISNWGKGRIGFGDEDRPPTPFYGEDGMGYYCGRDTGYAAMLREHDIEKLRDDPETSLLFKNLILPGIEAYAEMELNGIWVDFDRVRTRRAELETKFNELTATMMPYISPALGVPDLGNEHWLRKWLFNYEGRDKETHEPIWNPHGLRLEWLTTTAARQDPQVDEATLKFLGEKHPATAALLAQRHITKAFQFFDSWDEWSDPFGFIHPFFNLTGTVTGRRSCDRPNLQQVPRDKNLRSCIGAPPGWVFLEVDYSQIEVRLAAWEAGEDNMLRIFSDPDGDIYRYTAAKLMDISEDELRVGLEAGEPWAKLGRQKAKAVVLGFLYGMGSAKFGIYAKEMYNVDLTDDEAEEFRETFFRLYPRLVAWHDRQRKIVARPPYVVRSLVRRARHLIRILSQDWSTKGKAERQAINSPIQGMGGDLTLSDVVSLRGVLDRTEVLVCGDVHDALLFRIREDVWKKWTRVILQTMEEAPLIRSVFRLQPPVRLKAEAKAGRYWGEPATTKNGKFFPEFSLEELDDMELAA